MDGHSKSRAVWGCQQQVTKLVTDTMILKRYYVINLNTSNLKNLTIQNLLPGYEQSGFVPHLNHIYCLWGQNFSSEVTEFLSKAENFHLFPMKIFKIYLPLDIDTQLTSNWYSNFHWSSLLIECTFLGCAEKCWVCREMLQHDTAAWDIHFAVHSSSI